MSEPTIEDPTILRWYLVRLVLNHRLTPAQFIPVEAAVNALTTTKTLVVNTWGNPVDCCTGERLAWCGYVQAQLASVGAVEAAEAVLHAVGRVLGRRASAFAASSDFALALDAVQVESPDLEPKVAW